MVAEVAYADAIVGYKVTEMNNWTSNVDTLDVCPKSCCTRACRHIEGSSTIVSSLYSSITILIMMVFEMV